MIIYGAGMSGLLAATMLRRFEPVIHEAASELPNNHAALLRFRSDAVSKATGIPFKKVWVQKAVWDSQKSELTTEPNIMLQNLYSMKVAGSISNRSIGNLSPGERFIAPEDFIFQISKNLNIKFGKALDRYSIDFSDKKVPTISTIPMNSLMKIVDWSDFPVFKYNEITTLTAEIQNIPCEVYQTIYIPNLSYSAYRASITGNKLIIECIGRLEEDFIKCETFTDCYLKMFFGESGTSRLELSNLNTKVQKYGKLVNSTGKMGKEFILAMTDLYGIYSLGRFATWRQILMDDVVHDVKVIESMIEQRDNYTRRLRIV